MPHWSDTSSQGYSMGAGVGLNPTNRQLPGLGGRSWNGPVKAGSATPLERVLGALPTPDGDELDWDSPGEVIAGALTWGATGETGKRNSANFGFGLVLVGAVALAALGILPRFLR